MRERLKQRLTQLRGEFQEGQKAIAELESKLTNIRTAVIRISGAIQVLEEELAAMDTSSAAAEQERGESFAAVRKTA